MISHIIMACVGRGSEGSHILSLSTRWKGEQIWRWGCDGEEKNSIIPAENRFLFVR